MAAIRVLGLRAPPGRPIVCLFSMVRDVVIEPGRKKAWYTAIHLAIRGTAFYAIAVDRNKDPS